ncbi:hypothetical protein Mgra_00004965 [Meloidogyne graminicola]|uniref:ceramide glucosyltransferase n=1 Tax=Meloidogyne graminicola TaxID=189291 RepID=A0A8S9ZPQ6_9BILA|nr:hypothetical protein Mgra_00004965 [Meloidogyne graminicola]
MSQHFGDDEDYQQSSSFQPGPSGEAFLTSNLEIDISLSENQFISATPSTFLSLNFGTDKLEVQRIFATVGVIFILGIYLLHIVAIVYGRHRLHKFSLINKEEEQEENFETKQKQKNKLNNIKLLSFPGVSILKPLLGIDENLKENLESFFLLDYPQFELLFCLYSRQDPAYELVQNLCAKYPNVETKIFIGGQRVGLNPKINNMFPGYIASKYSHLLISDQGIYMHQNALTDMVLCMLEKTDIALVTQTPFCKDRIGIWAALEQVYFGGAHSRIYLASHAFRFVCSTGMSALMLKEVLEQCGGFKQFGAFLAEDYFLGQAFARAGYRNVISHMPALQNSANASLFTFQERICRWVKLRIAMLPHTIILEPAQECFFSSLVGALSFGCLFGNQVIFPFLAFHYIYWATCDFILLRTLQNGQLSFPITQFLLCWILRELIAFPIFVKAVLNPHIGWRFGTYKLCWGGRIKPLKEN